MQNNFARYDILINSDNNDEQLNVDLILNSTNKKVIHGTVWDDNPLSPERVPGALIQLYVAGENYKDDPLDIKPIGNLISDASGEFLAGPFEHSTSVILKIFKICNYDAYNEELKLMKFKYIVVFVSNSYSTLLYKNLLRKGCKTELISAPSSISRGCTKAIRFDESDTDIVVQEIKSSKLIVKGIYKIVNESNGTTSYVLIS